MAQFKRGDIVMSRVLAGTLLLAVAAPGLADDIKPFTSEKGRFAIAFPGKPKEHKQTVVGIENIAFAVELKNGPMYLVSYFDLPVNVSLSPDTSVKAYAGGRKGKLLSQKRLVLDEEYPGREGLVELPDGKQSRIRVYIVKQRYYQVVMDGSRDAVASRAADAFFDSFKLTK